MHHITTLFRTTITPRGQTVPLTKRYAKFESPSVLCRDKCERLRISESSQSLALTAVTTRQVLGTEVYP